jgi:hypothetical protein
VDYERIWSARQSAAHFGQLVTDAWASKYLLSLGADHADLVIVDPGNGFKYLFDLADTLVRVGCRHEPRVVGVWGLSCPAAAGRDSTRMRGHPRPARGGDDRGHLISCAAGGGYDINLVPMAAELNRGWSAEGARFRALERTAAAWPGTLFFIRPVYEDATDRPSRFDAGVQLGDDLIVDTFANVSGPARPSRTSVMRQSAAFPLDAAVVLACLDPASAPDRLFAQAWRSGPSALTRAQRCAVAGTTGHIAESVTEVLLDGLQWRALWHHRGPGPHGVDLIFLTPDDQIVAVEVKGTLVAGRVLRLPRGEIGQMSTAWVDKADNPWMAELDVRSSEIYGAATAVNFADMTWRAALTDTFVTWSPVTDVEQLRHPAQILQRD